MITKKNLYFFEKNGYLLVRNILKNSDFNSFYCEINNKFHSFEQVVYTFFTTAFSISNA